MTWRPSDLSAAIPHATSSRTTAPCPPSSLTRIDAVPSEAVESLVPWCGWHGVQGGQDLNRPHGHRHGNATNLVDIPERGCGVVWVVQAGRGMVRGHDQPSGSTTAQPAVGPHPAPAAAPPRRRPPPCPRPQLRGRVAVYGPHLHPLEPAARQGAGLRQRAHLLAPPGRVGPRRVFEQLQAVLLDELGEAGRLDLERSCNSSSAIITR